MNGLLSIFVDESGDFGKFDPQTPYYIVSMIFHNQCSSIQENLDKLNAIQYKTFVFEKRPGEDVFSLEGRMSKEISLFLRENLDYFQSFEDVILYYDNGQHELNRILNFALSAELSTYSYRKVLPKDYKLFQSADLICTLKLLNLKCDQGKLSKSEELFFHSIRDLRKQFIKPVEKKKFNSSN